MVRSAADSVIIDATGAAAFDTATADHFQRMVKAAELLGAFCVLTGISPENAQSLTSLDVDFQNIATLGTLKQGLDACIEHQRKRRSKYARNGREPARRESCRLSAGEPFSEPESFRRLRWTAPWPSVNEEETALASETRLGPHNFLMGDDGVCVIRLNGAFEYPEAEQFVREMLAYQETPPEVGAARRT